MSTVGLTYRDRQLSGAKHELERGGRIVGSYDSFDAMLAAITRTVAGMPDNAVVHVAGLFDGAIRAGDFKAGHFSIIDVPGLAVPRKQLRPSVPSYASTFR